MPSECAAVGCSERLTKEFSFHAFPYFFLFFFFKWSQKTTVANGNESMGPSHKEMGTKIPRCALLKAFPKKNASQIAPCWAFSLGSNTCPQGNRLGKISSSNLQGWSSDAIASSWAFVYFPLVIPSFSSLVRCVAFLFRSVYSSFHNRLDLIKKPAFYWVFYFISPINPCLFHHT